MRTVKDSGVKLFHCGKTFVHELINTYQKTDMEHRQLLCLDSLGLS